MPLMSHTRPKARYKSRRSPNRVKKESWGSDRDLREDESATGVWYRTNERVVSAAEDPGCCRSCPA